MKKCSAVYAHMRGALPNERADCAVRAIAVAASTEYPAAHGVLQQLGRLNGRTTWPHQVKQALVRLAGGINEVYDERGMTLAQFVKARPHGCFVVFVRRHFVAIRSGVVHDWAVNLQRPGSARRRVIDAWEVL